VAVTYLPVTRCQICHRTVLTGPAISARSWPSTTAGPTLKRSASLPGSRPPRPRPSAHAAAGVCGLGTALPQSAGR